MNEIISVKNVSKTYKILKKEPGLIGSIKNLVSRKYEEKIAVDQINFSIHEIYLISVSRTCNKHYRFIYDLGIHIS